MKNNLSEIVLVTYLNGMFSVILYLWVRWMQDEFYKKYIIMQNMVNDLIKKVTKLEKELSSKDKGLFIKNKGINK